MKVNARCEWVSPTKEITTKKGENMLKLEAKFHTRMPMTTICTTWLCRSTRDVPKLLHVH